MQAAHRRHDISDTVWERLEMLLPGRKGTWGGNGRDNRLFINAIFWILRTGAPWRDLPPDYGCWNNTHRRFSRWRDKGVWERILEALIKYDVGLKPVNWQNARQTRRRRPTHEYSSTQR